MTAHPTQIESNASAIPVSYATALSTSGLVAPQHKPWLNFCDTTRLKDFQLGHTLPQVWAWLADYYERANSNNFPTPQEIYSRKATRIALADTLIVPPPKLSTITFTQPSKKEAQQQQERSQLSIAHLVKTLREAGLLPKPWDILLQPAPLLRRFSDRESLLLAMAGLGQEAHAMAHDSTLIPGLVRAGVILPAQTMELQHAMAVEQLLDPVDILPYLTSRTQLFSRDTYPDALGAYLQGIYKDVAHMLPNMAFTDFHYKVEVPPEFKPCRGGCPDNRDIIVTLRVQGKRYKQRCQLWEDTGLNGQRLYSVNQDEFYEIFNQVLADRASLTAW
ncbi:hypothetical protein LRS06_21300 [Hymenobacter sp. J193]|uniref:hypothetical protein n=1 Tax=Hymenobacter sp. J193 TaxID=2898429 RepID=UPI002151A226|nr:hypothetical protein [Hymenobacter sp. J193]MCR5890266.1 hypothetical protein [Hymenobacter sp. J193]